MGSRNEWADEEPIHRVRITRPFDLGIYPVTQAQFAVWTKATGSDHKNHFESMPNHPAENLNWHEATAFCEWLNSTYGPRLPLG